MPTKTSTLGALLALATGLGAAPEIQVALPDTRGTETFRVIRQGADGTFTDLTPQGIQAGTGPDGSGTFEVRSFFKPVFFAPGRRLQGLKVLGAGIELGGAVGSLELVGISWGSATPPSELFAAASTPVTTAGLIEVFQGILDDGGDSSGSRGFVIKSAQPLAAQGAFRARFNVRLQEGAAWTVDLRSVTLPSGRLLAEFKSSRRGLASLTVAGRLAVEAIPVAREILYRWVIPESLLAPGANEIRVRVLDPDDQTSAEGVASVTR